MLLFRALDALLLVDRDTSRLALPLRRVVDLGMDAGIPNEKRLEPNAEVMPLTLLALPHLQPVRVERHQLGLPGALHVDVAGQQVSEVLRDLVTELHAHAHVGDGTQQSFHLFLRLVPVPIGGEVR